MRQTDREELVEILANYHIEKYGLKGWKYKISRRMTKTLGTCCWETKTIQISASHIALDSLSAILDTLVHELAHASVDENVEAHGREFQNAYERIRLSY